LTTRQALAIPNEDCLVCHEDESFANDQGVSLHVAPDVFDASVHGQAGIGCIDCHADLADAEDFPHDAPLTKVDCSMCHDAEAADYDKSIHGESRLAGDESAPVCSTCHGTHNIRSSNDPESTVFPVNLVGVCEGCHTDVIIVEGHNLPSPDKIRAYEGSVHMKALKEKGLVVSAACNDCHGSHKIRPASDPESITYRFNLPKTCAKCHYGIYQTYVESVHGLDYLKRNKDVPICTDCHGEHSIKSHANPDSSVYATNVAAVCSRCHEDETLSKRYGFASSRLKTYLGTYHGIAQSLGDVTVANCASCHGYHDIKPPNDPRSSVHPDNIPATCGKCHPQAGRNFAVGKVHVAEVRESSLGAYVVQKFYTLFIVASIGGFVVFIVADLFARRRKAAKHKQQTDAE
jgi:hypothetical protein